MKKLISLSLIAAMGLSLAACGGNSGNNETKKTSEPAGSSVATEAGSEASESQGGEAGSGTTLAVGIWDENQRAGLQEIMDDFAAESGIKAEIQVVDWVNYWTQLAAGASGGELPDVFWMHSNESQRYMDNGMLMDLTDRIEKSDKIDLSKYPEDIVKLYQLDGKQYAIPKDIDTIAVWYNKAMFDAAGVEYPKPDWTWDDFYEIAVKLTDKEKETYGLVIAPDNNQAGYYNVIYDYGGYVISDDKKTSGMDDPKTIEAMKFVDKLVKDTMPPLQLITENKEDGLLLNGKVAMALQGSWMLPAYKSNDFAVENFDIQVLPNYNGKRISIYNGISWTAAANTTKPEEAWQLIEYMGTQEAQQKQAELGVTMSAYENTSDAFVNSFDKFNLNAYLDMMNDMVIRPYSRDTVTWEGKFIEHMTSVWGGTEEMEDACKAIAAEMNDTLASEN